MEPFYTSDVYSTTSPASSFVRGETRLGYLYPIISLTGKVIANDFAVSTARTIKASLYLMPSRRSLAILS
jgi:hypothetical protein